METEQVKLDIMMVEDTPTDIEIMKTKLNKNHIDYEMTAFHTGEEALEHLETIDYLQSKGLREGSKCPNLPDLIILDLNLPGDHGLKILDKIKDSKVLRLIPVIINSTSDDDDDIRKAYRLGSLTFLNKFSDETALGETLKQMRIMGLLKRHES